jgi:Mn2+/Fe2+ NRAMP family transporter
VRTKLLNFLGFHPMKALVWSGIVQGFSVPPLLLLMMLMTNDRQVMGQRTNDRLTNLLGWITFSATFLAALPARYVGDVVSSSVRARRPVNNFIRAALVD